MSRFIMCECSHCGYPEDCVNPGISTWTCRECDNVSKTWDTELWYDGKTYQLGGRKQSLKGVKS